MREVRLALLEADVNFKVVKDFVSRWESGRSGSNAQPDPGQQGRCQNRQR